MRPGHLVGPARGDRLLLGQGGEPVVLLFGEDVVRLGRLQPGPGLVNAPRDLLAGELERLVGLGPVGPGGRLAPLRDLDLERHVDFQAGQRFLLPPQLRPGRVELGAGDGDLVAVRHRVDLRHHLALLDTVVLVHEEADDVPRHRLRRDVDDVGFDEGVVGDRVGPAVLHPLVGERAAGRRQRQKDDGQDEPAEHLRPRPGHLRRWGRRRRRRGGGRRVGRGGFGGGSHGASL